MAGNGLEIKKIVGAVAVAGVVAVAAGFISSSLYSAGAGKNENTLPSCRQSPL